MQISTIITTAYDRRNITEAIAAELVAMLKQCPEWYSQVLYLYTRRQDCAGAPWPAACLIEEGSDEPEGFTLADAQAIRSSMSYEEIQRRIKRALDWSPILPAPAPDPADPCVMCGADSPARVCQECRRRIATDFAITPPPEFQAQAAEIALAAEREAQREQMANGLRPGDMIRGKVIYKDRPYFMLEFGPPFKLASTSGNMVFLAKREHVSQYKWYTRPLTWQQIQDYRQELKNGTLVTCPDGEDPGNI